MSNYLNNLMEMNIALCIIFLLYILLLKNETAFKTKRLFLLLGMVLAIISPFVIIPSFIDQSALLLLPLPTYTLPEIDVPSYSTIEGFSYQEISWQHLIVIIHFVITIYFLLQLCVNLIRIGLKIKSTVFNKNNKQFVQETDEHHSCYSFFNYIFIGNVRTLSLKHKAFILEHERIHAEQYHSIDTIILQILTSIFWFNPIIYYLKKELIQLHEFEADARAIQQHDLSDYCSLLAKTTLLSADIPIANHFNTSLTVKRINMMKTQKTKVKGWKIALLSIIIPIFLFASACENKIEEIQAYDVAAEFADNGGEGFWKFLGEELRYPKEARDQKIEGTVYVQITVLKNGESTDQKVLKSPNELLSAEALRVAKLTKWKPATLKGKPAESTFVLPIRFKLAEE
jgi:TonB family protein